MANVAAGTVWNLPNYVGELYTADMTSTPFLSAIGGMTGGQMTTNFEFATASEYSQETASQPAITETDSLTAPTAISYVRDQSKNVTQIFMEQVSISYKKAANAGRLSGINTAGSKPTVMSEKVFQTKKALEKIARDIEYTFLNGAYQISTAANVADKTRGMIELCTVNTVAASSADFSKALLDSLLLEMFGNGAQFKNAVLLCNGFQKQAISNVYGYAPEDRNVGGLNIKQIETDFCSLGIMPAHRFMPTDTILIADLAVVAPVFQEVPDKGLLFYEELARTGASEKGQIFGLVGLNHGPSFMHGTLTGLSTS